MPFGSKCQSNDFLGARPSKPSQSADSAVDSKKSMKVAKDYDSVKNTVMEGDSQVMHNKNQTISNLKKPRVPAVARGSVAPLPKGARK